MSSLTHFDSQGQAHMVDVAAKASTHRVAVATGRIEMLPETLAHIRAGNARKGDGLGVARIAGIPAAKKTSDLIPLCHPLALTRIALEFGLPDATNAAIDAADASAEPTAREPLATAPASPFVRCTATVETIGPTGVEMEALTAVQIALLTIYDMCKAVDRGMTITGVKVLEKHGGKSGRYLAA